MFNSIRYIALLIIVMVPALVQAQHAPQAPCPPAAPAAGPLVKVVGPEFLAMLSHQGPHINQNQDAEAAYDSEKRKTFEKIYKVSSSDMLSIENKFGKVHINTWDKNEIKVQVNIITRASSEQKAQEILDNISISDKREGKLIALKTIMEPMRISGNTQKSFEINYTVYMPDDNPIAVKNSFGDVYLAAFKGKADISVKYGSLKTGRLNNSANSVKLAYGSGNCGYINGGNIEVSYSDMTLEGTNGLQGFSKFSDFKLGSLNQDLDMEVKYGSFRIDNVSKNIRKINLESGFSPISLNFEDNTAFNFNVNVQFGNFRVDKELVNITSLEKSHTSAEYKGKYGSTSPKGLVSIVSKYGDVKFTR